MSALVNIKNEIVEFYKRDSSIRLSKNLWLDMGSLD